MTVTYSQIATQTLGSAAASVTFSSIPGTYTDLVLIFCGSIDTTSRTIRLRFNSDSGTNYSNTYLNGDGTTAASSRATAQSSARVSGTIPVSTQGMVSMNIQNYSNTTTYKTVLSRGTSASGTADALVNLWQNTAAISSILVLLNGAGNFETGSTFSLYGIKAE